MTTNETGPPGRLSDLSPDQAAYTHRWTEDEGFRAEVLVRTAALDVEACRAAWYRALETGKVDVRHLEDVGQAERDRLTALGLDTACWLWTASQDRHGYGQVGVAGAVRKAHRVSWVAHNGKDLPPGFTTDHLCSNRACVNPAHLEPVTNRENTLRGHHPNMATRRTGVCARGHKIAGANVVTTPSSIAAGWRVCRACKNAATAANGRSLTGDERDAFLQAYSDAKAAEYLAQDYAEQPTDDGTGQMVIRLPGEATA